MPKAKKQTSVKKKIAPKRVAAKKTAVKKTVVNKPVVFAEPKQAKIVGPFRAIKNFFRKYFDFIGRSTRAEFWYGILFWLIVTWGFSWLAGRAFIPEVIATTVWAVLFIPKLSLSVRRFRDAGVSVWLYIIPTLVVYIIPIVRGAVWTKLLMLDYVSSGMLAFALFCMLDFIFDIIIACQPSKK